MQTESSAKEYEHNQSLNPINTWLHSFRYRHILDVVGTIELRRPIRVVEIGCAYAKLFDVLSEYFEIDYTGVEIDRTFSNMATMRHQGRSNFSIITGSAVNVIPQLERPDILIALETLEHIPEGEAVRTIEAIAALRPSKFVCSVPVEIGPALWVKNVGSLVSGYSRHREYTWAETFWAGLHQLDRLPPHGTGHKGFDWRWLAQTIRHNMRILETRRFPFGLPVLSTSVFMIAEPRP